jgi:hypothetical protein
MYHELVFVSVSHFHQSLIFAFKARNLYSEIIPLGTPLGYAPTLVGVGWVLDTNLRLTSPRNLAISVSRRSLSAVSPRLEKVFFQSLYKEEKNAWILKFIWHLLIFDRGARKLAEENLKMTS